MLNIYLGSSKIRITLFFTIFFIAGFHSYTSFGQTAESPETQSEEALEEAPKVIEQPAYEYFYWPEEDLNNFGLSTMGQGKSGSTLGEKSRRTSNVEANAYLKSSKEDKAETIDNTVPAKKPVEPIYTEPVEKPSAHPASDKPIYEWRDENGTLHMTNDLGKVPPEYQDQIYETINEEPGR